MSKGHYIESKAILKEVRTSRHIILNCHRSPDPDSIGSALALYTVLIKIGKKVDIYCPSEELDERLSYLEGYKIIKTNTDFSSIDYSHYDLMIDLDSSSWGMVTCDKIVKVPDIKKMVIDHHKTLFFRTNLSPL